MRLFKKIFPTNELKCRAVKKPDTVSESIRFCFIFGIDPFFNIRKRKKIKTLTF